MSIGILACGALVPYVRAAQNVVKVDYPIVEIDRNYHDRPNILRRMLEDAIAKFPEEVDTILAAMGACGNCWSNLSCKCRLVIPRMDDCVTILLHTDDEWHPNLKKAGHFYQIDEENEHFRPVSIYHSLCEKYGNRRAKLICDRMFDSYTNVDIVDTGVFDCHAEDYVEKIQKDADFIQVPLGFVEGSNRVLEKLVSGDWDDQFLIVEPEQEIDCDAFLELPSPKIWLER